VNRKEWFALVAVWGCLIVTPVSVYGSGFALFEAGARGSALMGTMVARADDPSGIFYNPAGLVQLPGFQVMGGFSFIVPRAEIVTHFGGVDTGTLVFLPMNGFL
jgi:long-chain fatty acid transport protein